MTLKLILIVGLMNNVSFDETSVSLIADRWIILQRDEVPYVIDPKYINF